MMSKYFLSLIFLLFTAVPYSLAQNSSSSALLAAIETLPNCAVQCLSAAIEVSPCQLTNQTCICADASLQANVEACVLQSCTIKQALSTKNATTTLCDAPIRDKTGVFRAVNIVLGSISAACVMLRLGYKATATISDLGLDDYFILITLVSGVPNTIMNDIGTAASGLGKDIWTLPFYKVTHFVQWFYIVEILYFVEVSLLKISLLLFYYRIFPGKPVRRIITATIVFDTLFGLAFVFAAIFQCRPINYYWTKWDGEHNGTCINVNALGWSNAAISIVLDFWMLAIPMSQLLHLKLAWKKKVGVAMMFCVGTFVTVVSILRLSTLVKFANTLNPTWDYFGVTNWSTIEINVGIICACMPAIRVVLVRLFPKILGSTRGTDQYYAKYGTRSIGKPGAGSRGMASGLGHERNQITFTRTVEIHSSDHDEIRLVEMDDLSGKEVNVKAGSVSQVSV